MGDIERKTGPGRPERKKKPRYNQSTASSAHAVQKCERVLDEIFKNLFTPESNSSRALALHEHVGELLQELRDENVISTTSRILACLQGSQKPTVAEMSTDKSIAMTANVDVWASSVAMALLQKHVRALCNLDRALKACEKVEMELCTHARALTRQLCSLGARCAKRLLELPHVEKLDGLCRVVGHLGKWVTPLHPII